LKNNPLALICIVFSIGIWLGSLSLIPIFLSCAIALCLLIAALLLLKNKQLSSILLCLAAAFLGSIHCQNNLTLSSNHIINQVSNVSQEVFLRGKVVSQPQKASSFYGKEKVKFVLKALDLRIAREWHNVQGELEVIAIGKEAIKLGDELLLGGILRSPPSLRNPGGFDYKKYLSQKNIYASLMVGEKDLFRVLSSKKSFVSGTLKVLKGRLQEKIKDNFNETDAGLISALLLGVRSEVSHKLKNLFTKTGTFHILAISGLHIGIIAVIVAAALKFVGVHKNLSLCITILVLVAYALLSGARASVVRATIMAVVVLLGLLLRRQIHIYNSLGLAGLILLLYRPLYLFDAGFQLSFSAVISIVYIVPKLIKQFQVTNIKLRYCINALFVSFAAWIGTAALIAYYFNIVTPISVIANFFVIPLLFLLLLLSMGFIASSFIWMPFAIATSNIVEFVLVIMYALVGFFSRIPLGNFYYSSPSPIAIVVFYCVIILVSNYSLFRLNFRRAIIFVLIVMNLTIWRPLLTQKPELFRATFLDVGHGDAIFLEFPNGGTMLIDSGEGGDFDAGRNVILPFLRSKGINQISAAMLTHPDADHIGGISTVLDNVKIGYVFDNGMRSDSLSYKRYEDWVDGHKMSYRKVKRGDVISGFEGVDVLILHPYRKLLESTGADPNNNSIVLKIVYKNVSFLFCADIQQDAISRLIGDKRIQGSMILKVPHHGTEEINSNDFIKFVSPQIAVISAPESNRFNCYRENVIKSLRQVGSEVYVTGLNGAVIICTDGENVDVQTIAAQSCL